jgi:fluoroacetyl-CoA thioesterase
MKKNLRPGLEQHIERVVTRELSVRGLREVPPVLATAEMIRLMEIAAHLLLEPFYDEGESSVGTRVDVSHTAATPLGMRVRADAKLVGVDGNRYYFEVTSFDEKGEIGRGTHERTVINVARFRAGMEKKLQ